MSVCAESIYRYVYQNKNSKLYQLLPRKKAKRRSGYHRKSHFKKPQIAMRNISYRAAVVNARNTIGHWEGDTIQFPKEQKACVTTLVERMSRFVCLRKNEDKKTLTVMNYIQQMIKSSPKKMWDTITFDQGSEFMAFGKVERQTKCKVYFCDPRSPWQRGSNENMNGRLRRFLPKNFKIDELPQDVLNKIAYQANTTPRKCLGYQTPREVFRQHWKTFCRTAL